MLPHVNADGDAIGSCLALREIIISLGGRATVLLEENLHDTLEFLNGETEVYSGDSGKIYDFAAAVDCGDLNRLGERAEIFTGAASTICIDHHATNPGNFAEFEYIDGNAAATAEIIFDIAKKAKVKMNMALAGYIYTAIVTDTGGFRYSNTTAKTMNIAAELLSFGVDGADICTKVFENKKYAQFKIEAKAINTAEFYHNKTVAMVLITEDMLKEAEADYGDADAVSGILRGIEGVLVAVVIKEKDGKSKISMRSKNVDISELCREMGGGGHKYAAGAEMDKTPLESREMVLDLIGKRLKSALYK